MKQISQKCQNNLSLLTKKENIEMKKFTIKATQNTF